MRDWGRLRAFLFYEGIISDFHRITEEERNDTVNAGAVVEAIGIVLNRAVSFEFMDGGEFYRGLGYLLLDTGNSLRGSMAKIEERRLEAGRSAKVDSAA